MEFLEFIPIILACVAIVTCSSRYIHERRKSTKFSLFLATIASMLLIIAQTSWWDSVVNQDDLLGTVFANHIWLLFNTLTTFIFITISYPSKSREK